MSKKAKSTKSKPLRKSVKPTQAKSRSNQREWQSDSAKRLPKNIMVRRDVTATDEKASDLQPTRSSFALYLREIAEENLLTPQDEIDLAAEIKKGNKAARDRMIRANLRLVVKIARDYESFGLPLLDLINEGNIGLMKAVDKFDPTKGAKFSTYSSWWIKQAIKRSLSNQSKTIRLPIHLVEKIAKLRNVTKFDLTSSFNIASNISITGQISNLFDKEYSDSWGYRSARRSYYLTAATKW
jgi:RNA polymerase sigma factor (sigma-70 family)